LLVNHSCHGPQRKRQAYKMLLSQFVDHSHMCHMHVAIFKVHGKIAKCSAVLVMQDTVSVCMNLGADRRGG